MTLAHSLERGLTLTERRQNGTKRLGGHVKSEVLFRYGVDKNIHGWVSLEVRGEIQAGVGSRSY
jgi:hypothetical protein